MIDPNALKSIEDLHRLRSEGIITDEEFERSKERLLFGPGHSTSAKSTIARFDGTLPAADDHFGWVTLPLRRYADFQGRSGRKEYWMFQIIPFAVIVVGLILASVNTDELGDLTHAGATMLGLAAIALLALLIPQIAVQVRRFHDMDRSGWFTLINLVPYVGAVIVVVVMLFEGTKGDNRYGPDPRLL